MSEAEKWAEIIHAFQESGQSQRVWSKENGIKRGTLRYWLERLDEMSEGGEIYFAEIQVGGEEI